MDEDQKAGTIEHAESFLRYFAEFSGEEPLFKPELECATQVVTVMREASPSDCPDVEIRHLLSELENSDHYDGSGWHGFKNAVRWWVESRGGTL